jgi:chemotaxis protein MotB
MAADEPKKKKCPGGAPGWMVTFGDMMSLLLTFFVLLLSFSVIDEVEFVKVSGSLKDAFGVQKEKMVFSSPTGELMFAPAFETVPFDVRQELFELLESELEAGLVDAEEVRDSLIIRVKDALVFESGKAEILPGFLPLLNKIGKVVKEADATFFVSGHTDNVPVMKGKPFETNWGLSTARAVAVVEYLAEKHRIPSSRLAAVGFADGRPIASNSTSEGRARNRRVEFEIKPKAGQAFQGIEELNGKIGEE